MQYSWKRIAKMDHLAMGEGVLSVAASHRSHFEQVRKE